MWKITITRDEMEPIVLDCVDEEFSINVSREIVHDDETNTLVRSPISYLELYGKMVTS